MPSSGLLCLKSVREEDEVNPGRRSEDTNATKKMAEEDIAEHGGLFETLLCSDSEMFCLV